MSMNNLPNPNSEEISKILSILTDEDFDSFSDFIDF